LHLVRLYYFKIKFSAWLLLTGAKPTPIIHLSTKQQLPLVEIRNYHSQDYNYRLRLLFLNGYCLIKIKQSAVSQPSKKSPFSECRKLFTPKNKKHNLLFKKWWRCWELPPGPYVYYKNRLLP